MTSINDNGYCHLWVCHLSLYDFNISFNFSKLKLPYGCFIFFLMFIDFGETERHRQSASGGGAKKERDSESEAGSRL